MQHTGPEAHFGPQRSTSCSRKLSSGSSANPLSTQGNCPPKKLLEPQWSRNAHRPASCTGVKGSATAYRSLPSKSPPAAASASLVMIRNSRKSRQALFFLRNRSEPSSSPGPYTRSRFLLRRSYPSRLLGIPCSMRAASSHRARLHISGTPVHVFVESWHHLIGSDPHRSRWAAFLEAFPE